jgi:hypothetical protein
VWVARFIGVRMMNAMRHNPIDGAAFQGKQAAEGQEILDNLWSFITTMRQ